MVPAVLWGVLRWYGSEGLGLIESWALYGYANIIWIPVAIISWSPIQLLNYIFVGIGFALSGVFLVRNLWPIINGVDAKTSRIIIIAIGVLHAGLAIAIKILFFA